MAIEAVRMGQGRAGRQGAPRRRLAPPITRRACEGRRGERCRRAAGGARKLVRKS